MPHHADLGFESVPRVRQTGATLSTDDEVFGRDRPHFALPLRSRLDLVQLKVMPVVPTREPN